MISVDMKNLLGRMNPFLTKCLTTAAGLSVSRNHYEVRVEHLLAAMAEDPNADFQTILRHYEQDPARVFKLIQHEMEQLKSGNSGRPTFAPSLLDWIETGWLISSVDHGLAKIRSGALVYAMAKNRHKYVPDEIGSIADSFKLDELSRSREVMERVGAEIRKREGKIRREMRAAKKSFLGVPAIMRQHHTDTPTSKEPQRELSPKVAAKDKWRRIELLRRLKQFAIDYRDALVRWLAGETDVQFPVGTYQLRVQFGVPVADV